jgi:hypothetical protein
MGFPGQCAHPAVLMWTHSLRPLPMARTAGSLSGYAIKSVYCFSLRPRHWSLPRSPPPTSMATTRAWRLTGTSVQSVACLFDPPCSYFFCALVECCVLRACPCKLCMLYAFCVYAVCKLCMVCVLCMRHVCVCAVFVLGAGVCARVTRLDSAVPWPYFPAVQPDPVTGRLPRRLLPWESAGMLFTQGDAGTADSGALPLHPLLQPVVPFEEREHGAPVTMVCPEILGPAPPPSSLRARVDLVGGACG